MGKTLSKGLIKFACMGDGKLVGNGELMGDVVLVGDGGVVGDGGLRGDGGPRGDDGLVAGLVVRPTVLLFALLDASLRWRWL